MAAIGGAASMRAMRAAVIETVTAAIGRDGERFELAVRRLAAQDQQRLRLVQGQIVRELLEELYPDGLSGADAQDVLERCVQVCAGWYPAVDATILLVGLLGALNAQEPDEQPAAEPVTVAAHGSLLIADLLATTGDPATRPAAEADLDSRLDRAFAEIERAETMELP